MLSVTNKPFFLNVIALNVIMLSVTNKLFIMSVIMVNVMLSVVVAPCNCLVCNIPE
jgi:hypothetical protein